MYNVQVQYTYNIYISNYRNADNSQTVSFDKFALNFFSCKIVSPEYISSSLFSLIPEHEIRFRGSMCRYILLCAFHNRYIVTVTKRNLRISRFEDFEKVLCVTVVGNPFTGVPFPVLPPNAQSLTRLPFLFKQEYSDYEKGQFRKLLFLLIQ